MLLLAVMITDCKGVVKRLFVKFFQIVFWMFYDLFQKLMIGKRAMLLVFAPACFNIQFIGHLLMAAMIHGILETHILLLFCVVIVFAASINVFVCK
jgi:hypothetical protein